MANRPNTLLVVTDQQRRDTVEAYGGPITQIPNIDGLAAKGMVFIGPPRPRWPATG